jgi:hypothetical protein
VHQTRIPPLPLDNFSDTFIGTQGAEKSGDQCDRSSRK